MSMVHASAGRLRPASAQLRSSRRSSRAWRAATLPHSKVALARAGGRLRPHPRPDRTDHPRLRRLQRPHPHARRLSRCRCRRPERRWPAPTGKAMFSVFRGVHRALRALVRRRAAPGLDPQPRPVQPRRSTAWTTATAAMLRPARRAVHASGRSRRAGPGARRRRRHRDRRRRAVAATARHHGDRVRHRARPVGAYYPEANVLAPLDYIDQDSGTPSYKSIPVRLVRTATALAVAKPAMAAAPPTSATSAISVALLRIARLIGDSAMIIRPSQSWFRPACGGTARCCRPSCPQLGFMAAVSVLAVAAHGRSSAKDPAQTRDADDAVRSDAGASSWASATTRATSASTRRGICGATC